MEKERRKGRREKNKGGNTRRQGESRGQVR